MNDLRRRRLLMAFVALQVGGVLGACGGGGGGNSTGVAPPSPSPSPTPAPSPSPSPAPSPAPAPPAGSTGLDFPSNGDAPAGAYVAFRFLDPHLNGLPLWGPGDAGVTYLWKFKPRQQNGYYATIWWSNNGNFTWNNGSSDSYYGAHPYPRGGGASTTAHDWELAGMDYGTDTIITKSGNAHALVVDRWYSQALVISSNGDGTHTARFYIDLPSTQAADIIEFKAPAKFGVNTPPAPALTFGDSPWFASYQHERLSGVLRGLKIFATTLSQADMLSEAASDSLATSAGRSRVWYANPNPTPDDIKDKSGAGHDPSWADSLNRARLWTGS